MITAVLFLLGLLAMLSPLAAFVFNVNMHWIATLVVVVIGILLIAVGGYLSLFKKFFKIPKANEAIIRTGKGKTRTGDKGQQVPEEPEVAIGYGLWVIPMFHQFVHFRFQQFVFQIEKKGNEALQCSDGRLADVSATCKVSIPQTKENVLKFLAAAGERDPNAEKTYHDLTYDTLETSLRDAATNRPYDSVFKGREEVAQEVENSVQDDFSKIGVQLDTVKLREVEPTPKSFYKVDNPQHAVGLTAITVITEDQRLATETKILSTNQAVKEREVFTQKEILTLDQDRQIAQSEQEKQIAIQKAENERISREKQLEQEEIVGKREIAKERAVELESVEKDLQLQQAQVDLDKKVKTAQVVQQQQIEIAEREKQIAIAAKEQERANAEAARLLAEKDKEAAAQAVMTTTVTAEAEREKQKMVIAQEAASQRDLIKEQKAADAQAYKTEKEALGRKLAAEADYDAKVKAAEAEQKSKESNAAGLRAEQMVPVNVSAEQVKVEASRVEVLTKELAAKSEHAAISKELEIALATIQAEKEVGIAKAKALGEGLSSANMTIWGDATTAEKISNAFTNGQMAGNFMSGLKESTPEQITDAVMDLKDAAAGALAGLGEGLGGLIKKLTGVDVNPEDVSKIVAILNTAKKGAPTETA